MVYSFSMLVLYVGTNYLILIIIITDQVECGKMKTKNHIGNNKYLINTKK